MACRDNKKAKLCLLIVLIDSALICLCRVSHGRREQKNRVVSDVAIDYYSILFPQLRYSSLPKRPLNVGTPLVASYAVMPVFIGVMWHGCPAEMCWHVAMLIGIVVCYILLHGNLLSYFIAKICQKNELCKSINENLILYNKKTYKGLQNHLWKNTTALSKSFAPLSENFITTNTKKAHISTIVMEVGIE